MGWSSIEQEGDSCFEREEKDNLIISERPKLSTLFCPGKCTGGKQGEENERKVLGTLR